jgi:hypothetical protein
VSTCNVDVGVNVYGHVKVNVFVNVNVDDLVNAGGSCTGLVRTSSAYVPLAGRCQRR